MRKAIGAISLVVGGSLIAASIGSVFLSLTAGRTPSLAWLILGPLAAMALLHWGSLRLGQWPMVLGVTLMLFSGLDIVRALLSEGAPEATVPQAPPSIEFRLVADSTAIGLPGLSLRGTGEVLSLERTAALTEKDILSARAVALGGAYSLELDLTLKGARALSHFTGLALLDGAETNRRLGIVVDGELVAAPVIVQRISTGRASTPGVFSKHEASSLVHRIKGDSDLASAARPGLASAGIVLLASGASLMLLRRRIPSTAMSRVAGFIFLLTGAVALLLGAAGVAFTITPGELPDWEYILFVLCGLFLLAWGSRLSTDRRLTGGLLCVVLGLLLLFPLGANPALLQAKARDPLGIALIVLGLALLALGLVLILAWRSRRVRLSPVTQMRPGRNA